MQPTKVIRMTRADLLKVKTSNIGLQSYLSKSYFDKGVTERRRGLKRIYDDYVLRQFLFFNKPKLGFSKETCDELATLSDDQKFIRIERQLKAFKLTADEVERFIYANGQGPGGFMPMILGHAVPLDANIKIIQPPNYVVNVTRNEAGTLAIKFFVAEFPIADVNTEAKIGTFPGDVTTVFNLKKINHSDGFELDYIETTNIDIQRILNGKLLSERFIREKYCDSIGVTPDLEQSVLDLVDFDWVCDDEVVDSFDANAHFIAMLDTLAAESKCYRFSSNHIKTYGLDNELTRFLVGKAKEMTLEDVKAVSLLHRFQFEKKASTYFVADDKARQDYQDAIAKFYHNSINILLSSATMADKVAAMRAEAITQFKHQHQGIRLFADAMMLVSMLCFVLGLAVGGYRLMHGKTFFFSSNSTVKKFDQDIGAELQRLHR